MLLNAVPSGVKSEILASRTTSSTEVMFALFRRYHPGGLAERSRLLRSLVEPKTPGNVTELLEILRGWRRSLRRAQELDITTPDATLLLGAVDRMSAPVVKASSQAAFRVSSTRATLGVDVTPTLASVLGFADSLLAEAETLALGDPMPVEEVKPPTTVKVKAMATTLEEKLDKSSAYRVKNETTEKVCRFWGSEEGCWRGQDCKFKHDWTGIEKKGR